ncbi:MAG: GNAT family N-acetyltransferase [Candidatus Magasanikbacteria bacterium]|jgi:GNAT superfamily N-acetyltransferase|nr:GNAT family N-acetyltransferase [Candidatus Magasanikbacteria bacterium]MBT4314597.1 GNAT family N-acetyltransferase [Candidatus Magasanikbacteria bacterium]MBT4546770.1 GNAT family N-acetyltransferase [Candidatus Magasanikbacteria bacterium]MBT6819621.1 GNAT family N-acetyltransferase [Candidatus Magasanikbacteria bacterium]
MNIKKQTIDEKYVIKFTAEIDDKDAGRAFLYLIYNDLHAEPYALLEDVFVEGEYRSQGVGRELVKAVIEEAKGLGCYKLIGTSRHSRENVHRFYKSLGFKDHGVEFRIDF